MWKRKIGPLDLLENDYAHYRQRRQIVSNTMFEDQTILLALQNENACNPVLRASANAILERYGFLMLSVRDQPVLKLGASHE